MNNNIWVATSTLEVQSNENKNWSGEDDMNLMNAILASEKEWGVNSYTSKWLKSLKNRVQPQPKQEWSENDERMLDNIIFELEENEEHISGITYKIDWLKSLKNRVQPQPKQGEQKPTDKVEPKFKVGDWIVSNEHPNCGNSLMRIVEVGLTNYLCRYYNGQTTYLHEFIDKCYHLWTIQDAKDGDVLAFKDGTSGTLLYKESSENFGVISHCRIIRNSFIDKKESGWGSELLSPATKEQIDLLFQKMKEAGYEWDADKKELRKDEQKYWSEVDENMLKVCLDFIKIHRATHPIAMKAYDWLKSIKEKM